MTHLVEPGRSWWRVLVSVAICLGALGACGGDGPAELVGYERRPFPNVADTVLPSVEPDGTTSDFAFRAADDGLLLVYFGYTSCPDVCPTTLADVRAALDDLGTDRAERVALAMVTIDVDVDTPEVLAPYVRSFVPGAVAVRSLDDDALRGAAAVFGASYGETEVDGETEVFHSASLYAVDSAGDLVLTWPFGTTSSDLESDLGLLLKRIDAA